MKTKTKKQKLFKTKPLNFQKKGIKWIKGKYNGRVLLADEMGLGKSLQALYATIPLRRKRPIIVICPNSVKWSWEDEVRQHTTLHSWVLEGRKPPRRRQHYIPPIIILNWDIVYAWKAFLKRLNPAVIIADELHFAKNPKTQRARALKSLCRKAKFVIGLTGTPFENCPAELFVGLHCIRPDVFKSFVPFGLRYCGPRRTPFGVEYKRATNIPQLRKLLIKTCMIRRRMKDVLKDLPPVRRTTVPIDIKRKEYESAERDILSWLMRKGKSIQGVLSAPAMTRFGHLLRLVAEKKQKPLIEWIDTFLETTDRKLVVFGYHHAFLHPLYEHYKDQAVLVDGTIKGRKRKLAIDEFCRDDNKRLFFGNIMAAGTGINKLQNVCSDVAVAEFIWVPQKISQAIGRVNRLGQTKKVNAYYIIARNTVEHLLCKSLMRKQSVFDAVMDGKDVSEETEFDVLAEVVGELKRKAA